MFTYFNLINADIQQLEINLFEDLYTRAETTSRYQSLYIGIKWSLLGAFFASRTLYASNLNIDQVLRKFRNIEIELYDGTQSKCATLLDEGISSFVYLHDLFSVSATNFWPIHTMYESHEDLIKLVSNIAARIAEEVNNNFEKSKEKSEEFISALLKRSF